jgi:glycine/D-amino acid oxidase-like deaminating enzyme
MNHAAADRNTPAVSRLVRPRRAARFPSPSAYRSFWLEQARAQEDGPVTALKGSTRASICVVGGGFTGLWTALRLKALEPERDVVLLEADCCGGGASGRNGGFVMSWWSKFGALAAKCGADEAVWLARESADAIVSIGEFCRAHGIGDVFQHHGWLWIATSAAQSGSWQSVIEMLDRAGAHPFTPVGREDAIERSGSPTVTEAVFEESCATVQPARLALALRRAAIESGVRVYELSPMRSIEHGTRPRVRTPDGDVLADRVVLSLGSWTASHVPVVRRALVVVGSDMVTTAPIAELLDAMGVERGLAISDSRLLVNYFHRTHDDRMALGVGGTSVGFGNRVGGTFHGRTGRADAVRSRLVRLYPRLRVVPVESNWTGPVDRSTSGLPFFHREGRDGNVIVGAGFSGNGVGPSYVAGRILASLALDRTDAYARCGLVGSPDPGFPPEPIRYLGGKLVRRAVSRKEHADDRDKLADPLTRWLANLAPAGLVPTEKA